MERPFKCEKCAELNEKYMLAFAIFRAADEQLRHHLEQPH